MKLIKSVLSKPKLRRLSEVGWGVGCMQGSSQGIGPHWYLNGGQLRQGCGARPGKEIPCEVSGTRLPVLADVSYVLAERALMMLMS